ncbi:putative candidate secreted effector protein [Blumeria hordei DH14]|uniref:Putative candidate secreted effector protein n=1 Tax=Blumeria graminis f. sp. hordei (strain DH14) TaxID=546991 RepID=N1JEP4_BLUG1|nr:putative candidate secreted effector protein [Blumeria hordei DH14]
MRFSSTAIIFQCASIFVTVVLGISTEHIDKQAKSFDCEGMIVGHEQLSQKRELKQIPLFGRDPQSLSKIYEEKYYEKMNEHEPASKNVQFGFVDPAWLSVFRQPNLSQAHQYGDVLVSYEFFVLEDSSGRVCSILLQKIEQGEIMGNKWVGPSEYTLCTIREST